MKTYAITLRRNAERSRYIREHLVSRGLDYEIVDAVDGSLLTEEEMTAACDMEVVDQWRWLLTNGAIGAALSHYECCRQIVQSRENSGFIVEDDIVLPDNIKSILDEIEGEIGKDEIILMLHSSFQKCRLSTIGRKDLKGASLMYPIDVKYVGTAAAYVIGRDAAQGMLDTIKPICKAADSWYQFYNKKAFSSFRLYYPSSLNVTHFKSSIDYLDPKSIKGKLSNLINDYKIPLVYWFLKRLRMKRLNYRLDNYSLVEKESPIQVELKRDERSIQ